MIEFVDTIHLCRSFNHELWRNLREDGLGLALTLRKMPDVIELKLKAATQLKDRVTLQKAIISAVLHNYFVIAPFPEKYSLDHLPVMLDGAGLHILNAGASTMLFTTYENGNLNTLRKILFTALRGNTWLKTGHPRKRKLSRKAANLRKELQIKNSSTS
jgi:hypothetical protein